MRKILLILFILFFPVFGYADWIYSPHTGNMDYYEPASGTVGGLSVDTADAGDDGKYLVVDWGNTKIDYGTPAGGGDMTEAVWDGDADGFIDADAGGTDINTSASTGVPSIAAGTWSIAATLTHELGGLEADVSAYAGLVHITGGVTSAKTVTANGLSLIAAVNYAAMRTLLDLEAGTDFYAMAAADAAFEAELDNSAGLLAALSDETGTGVAVFGTNPTLTAVTITGDITATGAASDFDLIDNNASALSFDATGKTGIIDIVTTDGSEGVTMSGTLGVTGILTATAAGANVTFADGQLMDGSGITHTAATDEGWVLPTWADVVPTTDQAYIAWDAAGNALKIYAGGWLSFATAAAPLDAKYITQTADATLTAEQALGALASGILYSTTTTGVVSIATEAQLEATLGVGFGASKAATSGYILVMDGTDLESVAMSGDVAIAAGGATTIQANSVALTTDTTGNYTATIADAGNTTITVVNGATEGGAVTLDAVDLNCTDCINATEIEDIYVLIAGDTVTGAMIFSNTIAANGEITMGADFNLNANEIQSTGNIVLQLGDAAGANVFEIEDSAGVTVFSVDSDGVATYVATNNPYYTFNEDDASPKFAMRHFDTTTDVWQVGTTTSDPNTQYTMVAEVDGAGAFNLVAGGSYSIGGTQIALTNLSDGLSHGANHVDGGADDLDGDLLDIDYAESNYTPATTGVATDINDLAAHLEGIDNALGALGGGTIAGLTDVIGVDYTAGTILIGDGVDSMDQKAIQSPFSLDGSGNLSIVANLSVGDFNLTNVGDVALDSISADATDISIVAASGTVTVESVIFTGGALSSVSTIGTSSTVTVGTDLTITGLDITADGTEEVISLVDVASAVNEIQVTNAATGNPVEVGASGGDANIDLKLVGKGTGKAKTYTELQIPVIAWATDATVADGHYYFHIGKELAGMNLVYIHGEVITAGTTGTLNVDIRNVTQTGDVLSTNLTIDTGETGSDTAATPAVIAAAEDDMQENDVISIDIDVIHTTASKGLIITLGFELP